MSFYVTLPSNASPNVFPNNTPGHFFVKLPQTIDVSSNYEVGLVEIQFPNRYCSLQNNEVWIHYNSSKEGEETKFLLLTIPQGKYKNLDKLIEALSDVLFKREIEQGKVEIITTECNDSLKKIIVKTNVVVEEMSISEKLKKFFINPNYFGYMVTDNTRRDLNADGIDNDAESNLKTVFVYCDLVTSRPVGDVMVPLLRAVPVLENRPSSVFRIYDKPHYVSLNRFSFDTVEILLTDDLGQTVSFTSGISVVTLHFRARKNFDLQ